jgi:hypothetical protein
MKTRVILVALLMMVLAAIGSQSFALSPNDPKPPVSWGMNENQTKYIGDGCWKQWKIVKCTPYGNHGIYRYNPDWGKPKGPVTVLNKVKQG